ncbi:MAG: histidine phosphatase family protein [Firmicutes bacterium]|nr:histidine phosphatase family protein [Bacillota bacterium]
MRIGYQQDTSLYENYTAVILAAGLSSRMKDFKPLLAVDGRTAIEGLVEATQGAGIKDIVVVTGYRREDLQPVIRRYELTEAFNPAYETGMFSSIRAGIAKAAEQKYKGTLLIPVDCPLISISVLRKVMDEADGHFAVPTYEGKKGHPLYIPAGFYDEILTHDGEGGLKTITDRYWDQMDRIPVNEEGCIMDMDTPEGYEEIRQFVEQGFTRTKLSVAAARRRFILIRHGQTQQHEEPMFIGQYDVPLNDEGREQMQKLGVELAGVLQEHYVGDVRRDLFGTPLEKDMPDWSNTVYCSDLQRAQESAEIFAKALEENGAMVDDVENGVFPTGVTVKPLKGLREINLKNWDGRPIREIMVKYPEEYQRRGENLFAFKTGNGSENFYDMQYRVMKCLREILAGDDGKNVIIVSHNGVIRTIENNLKGLRVDNGWKGIQKGSYIEAEVSNIRKGKE